jgi:hypothetical protein
VSGRLRLALAFILLLGVLSGVVLVAYAGNACATDLPNGPCPDAGLHRGVVVALAGVTTMLLVVPFAFLAEFAARRRIVYRGMWWRALRRGLLAGLAIAALAGLRLGGALSVPAALFVVVMLGLLEWFAVRRLDAL